MMRCPECDRRKEFQSADPEMFRGWDWRCGEHRKAPEPAEESEEAKQYIRIVGSGTAVDPKRLVPINTIVKSRGYSLRQLYKLANSGDMGRSCVSIDDQRRLDAALERLDELEEATGDTMLEKPGKVPSPLAREEVARLLRDLASLEGEITTGTAVWARGECESALEGFKGEALAALEDWAGRKDGVGGVMRSGGILALRTLLESQVHEELTLIRLAGADLIDEVTQNSLTAGVAGPCPADQYPAGVPQGEVAGELPQRGGKKSCSENGAEGSK